MKYPEQKLYKYPHTRHLPWSPGSTSDDTFLDESDVAKWNHEVVITEKRDGENTTWYKDYFHVRSLDFEPHISRNKIVALHSQIAYNIPEGWRICGENLTAKHSIKYTDLTSIYEVFSIWDGDICLDWDDTVTFASVLNLPTVPVLYRGMWNEQIARDLPNQLDFNKQEGFVVRPAGKFTLDVFGSVVGKWVRKNHVKTQDKHWMRQKIEYNEFAK